MSETWNKRERERNKQQQKKEKLERKKRLHAELERVNMLEAMQKFL